MKRLLALLSLCLVSATGFAYQNEKDGFRDLTWGMKEPVKDAEWTQVVNFGDQDKTTTWYTRSSDKTSLGSTEFYAPLYGFDKDYGLYTVRMKGPHPDPDKNAEGYDKLVEIRDARNNWNKDHNNHQFNEKIYLDEQEQRWLEFLGADWGKITEVHNDSTTTDRLEKVLFAQYGKPDEDHFRFMIHTYVWLSKREEPFRLIRKSGWDKSWDFDKKWDALVNGYNKDAYKGTDLIWRWGFGENELVYQSYGISILRARRAHRDLDVTKALLDELDANAAKNFE